ncbi:CotH kinase family protein [Marinisporobacter balticus]|uniref:Spore coat protein H n=1 Tax=Marinisporobacter balticus TaxID=2018667 RepID=A0A4R2KAP4_9FIRM|nr:CotH kinase family protein [Marinisporobacter balticus]TCO69834.1 spore coat protein H [Marinisporobacter balticus]
MRNIPWGLSLAFFILISMIMFAGVSIEKGNEITQKELDKEYLEKQEYEKEQWDNPLNDIKLTDNKDLYKEDHDTHVDKIYITVLPPKNKETVNFEELNNSGKNMDYDYTSDAFDKVAKIIFEAHEPSNGNAYDQANATMELRGQTARMYPQKSYKIKLFKDTEKWIDFHTINFNKHYPDSLRIKNKLSYDYFELLDDFVSLRTRFVRLYIKDLSSKKSVERFEDYGLYTFIEQPNKKFLKRHNLDQNANLYKIENFEFYRYADHIKTKEDITYDSNKFEEILEIRGNDHHEKLIEMLDAVNDYGRDINEVVDQYFDRDNLMTWLAVNILFDNYDTISRNFLLYSPLNANKWFFIPWDYDKAWTNTPYRGKWQRGVSNYWGMVLFNRLFKDRNNVNELSKKIEDLSSIINEENTKKFLENYYKVVKENVLVAPDRNYLKNTISQYKREYDGLSSITEQNKVYYYKSLENPMPFYLGEPIYENEGYTFTWEASYDIDDDEIAYDFLLSKDNQFKNIVATFKNLENTSCNVKNLENGQYYWKVIAYDTKGNWQEAFDNHFEEDIITGTKKLIVHKE